MENNTPPITGFTAKELEEALRTLGTASEESDAAFAGFAEAAADKLRRRPRCPALLADAFSVVHSWVGSVLRSLR